MGDSSCPGVQRRARCEAWCEERDGSGDGEECCDKAVAAIMNPENREKQARDVSGAEWRSTGRPGGADGVE